MIIISVKSVRKNVPPYSELTSEKAELNRLLLIAEDTSKYP